MNDHDWAVVVGIGRYADAQAQPPWITNLNGPAHDAAHVAEWLTNPDGGALRADHVKLVCSPALPLVEPQQPTVVEAFDALLDLPQDAYQGQYAGRRLYVYASGHGMASQRSEAAVITAEATRDNALNVLVTSWVNWLWRAARFTEFVVWIDTCATRAKDIQLYGCDRKDKERADAGKGRFFEAFAAGYNYTAVEAEIDGAWRGVFTHTLLQALTGAGGTPVTTETVKKYLLNSMKTFMSPEQRIDPLVAKEPAFGTTDDLVLAAPAQQKQFPVKLRFPPEAVGKRVTISASATVVVADKVLDEEELELELSVGAYVAFVPELKFELRFEVTGGG